jgi:non-ribosomal peptide synthetase component E (peptide arylation enzyme)
VRGYYNAPERNAASFTSDGFYRSGDLMSAHVMDCGVCYRFRGRIKDVVDRAGEKISCQEVEDVIRTHPDVVDVAIVPVPDAIYGERACAFVVQRAGSLVLDVEAIGRHLQACGLAKFKWPERVEPLPEFPQTRVGKIDKEQLRERAHSTRSPESPAGAARLRSGS